MYDFVNKIVYSMEGLEKCVLHDQNLLCEFRSTVCNFRRDIFDEQCDITVMMINKMAKVVQLVKNANQFPKSDAKIEKILQHLNILKQSVLSNRNVFDFDKLVVRMQWIEEKWNIPIQITELTDGESLQTVSHAFMTKKFTI